MIDIVIFGALSLLLVAVGPPLVLLWIVGLIVSTTCELLTWMASEEEKKYRQS